MPAAAVIPAPIAYIKVVAVKKLVVGFRDGPVGPPNGVFTGWSVLLRKDCVCSLPSVRRIYDVYFEKIRVFKAGLPLEYMSME